MRIILLLFLLAVSAIGDTLPRVTISGRVNYNYQEPTGNTWTNDLVEVWKFDEASGNAIGWFRGTVLTNVTTAAPYVTNFVPAFSGGRSIDFEASVPNRTFAADSSTLSLGTDTSFTLLAWYSPESTTVARMISSKGNTNGVNTEWSWTVNSSGNVVCRIGNGSSSIQTTNTLRALTDGGTNLVAVVHNATNDTVQIYVDGYVSSASWSGGTQDTAGDLSVGATSWFKTDTSIFSDGRFDLFAYWKRALSTNDLNTLYNSGQGTNVFTP